MLFPKQPVGPKSVIISYAAVEKFVASMDPPKPELLPVLLRAGVIDDLYLRGLAKDKDVRNHLFSTLEMEGQLEREHCVLLTKALLATFGAGA